MSGAPVPRWLLGVSFAAIVACTLIVYANALRNRFVWDDWATIEHCQSVRSWSGLLKLAPATYFRSFPEMSYRPVVSISYLLDYQLWGERAAGYHLTSIVLHALTAGGVFVLALLVLRHFLAAVAAALLVGVHPIFTEPALCVSFREDVLAGLFMVLCVALLLHALGPGKLRGAAYALSLVCLTLALLSKEMAVTTPLLAALLLWMDSERRAHRGRNLTLLIPHLALVVLYVAGRFTFLHNPRETMPQYAGGSLYTAMLTMSRVVVFYLAKALWPANQGANYGLDPSRSIFDVRVGHALMFIAVAVAAAVLARRKLRGVSLGLAWFALALLPVSNLLPVRNVLADRFLYVPALGLCVGLAAFALSDSPTAAAARPGRERRSGALVPRLVLFGLVLAMMTAATVRRQAVWRGDLALWRNAILTGPADPTVYTNLGKGYAENGMLVQATRAFARAVALDPAGHDGLFNLAYAYLKLERPDSAIEFFRRALATGRVDADAHEGLGQAYLMKGELAAAEAHFQQALQLDPTMARAHLNYGRLLAQRGQLDEATEHYREALRLDPSYDDAHYHLAEVYRTLGQREEEIAELKAFLKITPTGERADKVRRRLEELQVSDFPK